MTNTPDNKSKKIDPQLIVAIAIMIVSVGALVISARQASIMNKQTDLLLEQTRSSSWPYLDLQFTVNINERGISEYKISVVNKGKGPAIIEGIKVSYNGKATKNWFDLLKTANIPDSINTGFTFDDIFNTVISDKEEITLLDVSSGYNLRNWLYKRADKIKIEICFKSVFDELWLVTKEGFHLNSGQKKVKRVESCPFSREEQFK